MGCPDGMILIRQPGVRGALREQYRTELSAAYQDFVAGNVKYSKNRPKIQAGIAGDFFVKRYRFQSIWNRWRHLFLPSRARWCAHAQLAVTRCGVATPEVRGFLRRWSTGLPESDFLFTAPVPEGSRFLNYAALEKDFPGDLVIAGITQLAARLHRAGIEHGDLNLRNIYWFGDGQFGVIDLDGCRLHRGELKFAPRCRELARLISSYIKSRQQEDLAAITEQFCQIYQKESGWDLRGKPLERRILFLLDRVFPGRYRKGDLCRN